MTSPLLFGASVVVGAVILQIVDAMTDSLTIDGFAWALAAAALISAFAMGASLLASRVIS